MPGRPSSPVVVCFRGQGIPVDEPDGRCQSKPIDRGPFTDFKSLPVRVEGDPEVKDEPEDPVNTILSRVCQALVGQIFVLIPE